MSVRKCAGMEPVQDVPRLGERVPSESVEVPAGHSLWRRFGQFELDLGLLQSADPKLLGVIFDGVFVLKADYDPCTDRNTYIAMSAHFDPVDLGGRAPRYTGIIHTSTDEKTGEVSYTRTWEKT